MKNRFADRMLFDQEPIDLVDPTTTGIPDAQFATISGKNYPASFEDIYQIINDARELGLKGLQINKCDYVYGGAIWEVWFAGSPEDIIIFSLKYKNIIIISQEKMNNILDKIKVLCSSHSEEYIDVCYVIARIATNEPVLIQTRNSTQFIDVSHLIDYIPKRY